MTKSALIQQVRTLRGGRMTKHKGSVASYAPTLGISLASTVSAIALSAALVAAPVVVGTPGTAAIAQDACTASSASGVLTVDCDDNGGPETTPQNFDSGVDELVADIEAGFDINVAAGNALRLVSDNGITVTQDAGSTIAGGPNVGNYGIRTVNDVAGDTIITLNGDVSGHTGIDIKTAPNGNGGSNAGTGAGNVSITTSGDITGNLLANGTAFGIYSVHAGTGDLTITATDGTISGGRWAIQSQNWNGGDLNVNTRDATVRNQVNFPTFFGPTLTRSGRGVYGRNWANAYDENRTINGSKFNSAESANLSIITGDVDVAGRGVFGANGGNGSTTIDTTAGTVTSVGLRPGYFFGFPVAAPTTGIGVEGRSYSNTTADGSGNSLTIRTRDVTGYEYGVKGVNFGSGNLEITSSGTVTATNTTGFDESNLNAGYARVGHIRARDGGVGIVAFTKSATATDIMITAENVVAQSRGVEAVNNLGDIAVTTSGDVTTQLDNAEGIFAQVTDAAATGNIVIRAASGSIVTNGLLSHGLSALNFGSGTAAAQARDANVTVTGDDTFGSLARAAGTGDAVSVQDGTGTITTNGRRSHGVFAEALGDGDALAEQTGTGTIITNRNRAHGVYALAEGAGDAKVNVTGGGTISTNGNNGGDGAKAVVGNNGGDGDATILFEAGSITTQGQRARGLDASVLGTGTGDALITMTGGTIETNNRSADGILINNNRNSGTATVLMSGGSITTNALANNVGDPATAEADGILILHRGTGEARAEQSGGTIVTISAESQGISVTGRAGGAEATQIGDASTSVTTSGDRAHGLRAQVTRGGGDTLAQQAGAGTITTNGDEAHGVFATSEVSGAGSGNNATAQQTGTGTITTNGFGAEGVFARAESDGAAMANATGGGLIRTNGDGSAGLIAQTDGAGTATVEVGGGSRVETNGDVFSFGALALAQGTGDAKVSVSGGSIIVTGADGIGNQGKGVVALQQGATGNAEVLVNNAGGLISTSGEQAEGVLAFINQGNGSASIELVEGAVETNGVDSQGVLALVGEFLPDADLNNGDAIIAMSGGSVVTRGMDSQGLTASTDGGAVGEARIGVDGGSVETFDSGSNAIFALAKGEGNAVIRHRSATATTQGAESDGLVSIALNGEAELTQLDALSSSNATGDGSDGARAAANEVVRVSLAGTVNGGRLDGTGLRAGAGDFDLNTMTLTPNFNAVDIDIRAGGYVGARSDHAILVDGGTANVLNNGTVVGYVTMWQGDDTFTNSSSTSFNIRNFEDLNNDTVRDTEAVAVNDFGAGVDTFNNTMTDAQTMGVVRLLTVQDMTGFTNELNDTDDDAPTAWNTAGQYQLTAVAGYDAGVYDIMRAGVEQAQFLNLETFTNAGVITMMDAETGGATGVVGDIIYITANNAADGTAGSGVFQSNGGELRLDTLLNEGSPAASQSDVMVVDTTETLGGGATSIVINNIGAPTDAASTDLNDNGVVDEGEGILVVEVLDGQNSAADAFVLNGDSVDAEGRQTMLQGAFAYRLAGPADYNEALDTGSWYLVNDLTAAVVSYEAVPEAMQSLNNMGTLQQRVGNRYWREAVPAPAPVETVFCKDASQNFQCAVGAKQAAVFASTTEEMKVTIDENAIWTRIEAAHAQIDGESSSTRTVIDTDTWQIQSGIDALFVENDNGKLIGGLNFTYGQTDLTSDSALGTGFVDTEGYGVGGSLTWYGTNGIYVDAQARYSWFESDLASSVAGFGTLAEDVEGTGYALSLEAGKRIIYSDTLSFTPQAQLTWSDVDFDTFANSFGGGDVEMVDGDRLIGRLGISVDHNRSWQGDNGIERVHLYGLANLTYDFSDGNQILVAGTAVSNEPDAWSGELGIGGSYNWADDKYSIHGEVSTGSSLENFGDSYHVKGNLGFRVKW